jgi:hypothetical protein
MGNYGETQLDDWYRRAALVIQTPLAAESSRFITDFDAALADALALAHGGRGDELAQRLRAAARSLDAQRHTRGRRLLDAYATLATALPDATHARSLCEGFEWIGFAPADAAALARLAGRWSAPWLQALVRAWAERAQAGHGNRWRPEREDCGAPWPKPLAAFIEAGQRAGLDGAVIDDMLDHCRAALAAADTLLAPQTPAVRHASLGRRLQALRGLWSTRCGCRRRPTGIWRRCCATCKRTPGSTRCAASGPCWQRYRRALARHPRCRLCAPPWSRRCSRRSPNRSWPTTTTASTASNGPAAAPTAAR